MTYTTPAHVAYVATCDFCPSSVEFQRDDSAAPFWGLAPIAPNSGSDHLATWCADCGPCHRPTGERS